MQITFHGAAGTVTGSKHLLKLDSGYQILLDCGMFQGLGTSTQRLNESFDLTHPKLLFLLSHDHIDHSGLRNRSFGRKCGYPSKNYRRWKGYDH